MKTLKERYGLYGHTISAFDLIHGIGLAAGLTPLKVEGATGYIDTNYEGKAAACLKGLETSNYIFLHVESPDESGHEGNLNHKLQAIEDFDKRIVGPVIDGLKNYNDYRVLIMPDHPTPISIRTHSSDPVPFIICGSDDFNYDMNNTHGYSEKDGKETGLYLDEGHRLLELMINGTL